jgi:thioesterase domain-containing protein/acyl carrier protein
MPDVYVPSAYVVMDTLPVSASGKVDRNALPDPDVARADGTVTAEPTSELEEALLRAWSRTLGVRSVGVHDDFFDLGGHSLLAVRLLQEVERELGIEVPVGWLVGAGATVAGLAATIERGGPERPPQALTRLFFVWPNELALLGVRHLQAALSAQSTIDSMVPDYPDEPTVTGLADGLYERMRIIQPDGPYSLAGFSLGGLIAYELAGRLRADGQQVRWLGLLDAPTPAAAQSGTRLPARVARFLARERRDQLRHVAGMVRRRHGQPAAVQLADPADPSMMAPTRAYLAIAAGYDIRPHDVPVDLFVSQPTPGFSRTLAPEWRVLHPAGVTVHRVDGNHRLMLTPPHVHGLAQLLAQRFEMAR